MGNDVDQSRLSSVRVDVGPVCGMKADPDGSLHAPALAAADVGLAMGSGIDVAMESAGVTLLEGDLTGIVHARGLSQITR